MGEWVAAVGAAFGSLHPPHMEKKKATIIALVDARLAGRPEESVWKQPGVCNRGTYHLKWKRDPGFAACLDEVTKLALGWKDGRAIRALQEAAERLALAAPIAVARVTGLLASDDEGVRLRAALGILDRAGVETATKAETRVEGEIALDPGTLDRLDQALMAAMYDAQDGDTGRVAGDGSTNGVDGE